LQLFKTSEGSAQDVNCLVSRQEHAEI